MSVLKHIHKYERTFPNRRRIEPIWKCGIAGCSHWLPYNTTVVGRFSKCWQCDETFTFDTWNLIQDKPICVDCAHPPVEYDEFKARMSELNEMLQNATTDEERQILIAKISMLKDVQ